MSRIPLGGNVPPGLGDPRPDDWDIDMPNQFEAADRIARNRGFTREVIDEFGLASQQKARVAVDEGRFKREIAALTAPVLDDEGKPDRRDPRRSTPTRGCATPPSRGWPA